MQRIGGPQGTVTWIATLAHLLFLLHWIQKNILPTNKEGDGTGLGSVTSDLPTLSVVGFCHLLTFTINSPKSIKNQDPLQSPVQEVWPLVPPLMPVELSAGWVTYLWTRTSALKLSNEQCYEQQVVTWAMGALTIYYVYYLYMLSLLCNAKYTCMLDEGDKKQRRPKGLLHN